MQGDAKKIAPEARFTEKNHSRKRMAFLAHPFKIDPYNKFFRNRSVFFGRWMDLSLGDDGSCTRPLFSGALRHVCKRIYVQLIFF